MSRQLVLIPAKKEVPQIERRFIEAGRRGIAAARAALRGTTTEAEEAS